jgi:hypothetical protein
MNEQTEPWRVVKRDDYTQRQTNIGVLIDGHVYELGDVNNERNRINAHLIAAAPEMLAALESAREFIADGMAMGFVGMPEDENVLDVIEKAISKAKGESC